MTNAQTIEKVMELVKHGEGALTQQGEEKLRQLMQQEHSVKEYAKVYTTSRQRKEKARTHG